ncbi:ArsR/SmtB family transcription factor [Melioribacter sp. Ez-97]|uniref:ArsR/SmtB family transcription factor n=1 Tax=Melioribacter sp. Ez-97 TaxID=3423434 RepID=UPI003ED9FA6F
MKNKVEAPVCGVTYIDKQKVRNVEKGFPSSELVIDTADILKVLGDPTRLKIIMALTKEELCVCDLSALTDVSVSAVSHQLRLLRGQGLVKYRNQGKMVYYSLADEHINNIIAAALEHAEELHK